MDLSALFNNHWLLISFLAPLSWAVVNIIDVYFVKRVYRDSLDGAVISGLFQIVPFMALIFFLKADSWQFFGRAGLSGADPAVLAALFGGFLFTVSFYFYFKALFSHNDAALLQIVWSLTVVVVPLLSFLFFKETLPRSGYLGMGVTLLGAAILSLSGRIKAKFSPDYLAIMSGAVLFLSLSMILEGYSYGILDRSFGNQGFLIGFMCFTLGAFLGGIFFALIGKRNPWPAIKPFWKVFIILEGVNFLGNLASQRAISTAPAVSYVAAVETFVPVFIMLLSSLIVFFSVVLKRGGTAVKRIYTEQFEGVWVKVLATAVMAVGIYILS